MYVEIEWLFVKIVIFNLHMAPCDSGQESNNLSSI
jgi:hypothetical protein